MLCLTFCPAQGPLAGHIKYGYIKAIDYDIPLLNNFKNNKDKLSIENLRSNYSSGGQPPGAACVESP